MIKEIVEIILLQSQLYNRVLLLGVFQITVGRSTADNHVDVDLSLEGPAWKISRRQVSSLFCIYFNPNPLYVRGVANLDSKVSGGQGRRAWDRDWTVASNRRTEAFASVDFLSCFVVYTRHKHPKYLRMEFVDGHCLNYNFFIVLS